MRANEIYVICVAKGKEQDTLFLKAPPNMDSRSGPACVVVGGGFQLVPCAEEFFVGLIYHWKTNISAFRKCEFSFFFSRINPNKSVFDDKRYLLKLGRIINILWCPSISFLIICCSIFLIYQLLYLLLDNKHRSAQDRLWSLFSKDKYKFFSVWRFHIFRMFLDMFSFYHFHGKWNNL